MTPHGFQEMIAHPQLPAMGFAEEVYLIAGGLVQVCGRIARIAGPLELVVQGALVIALWCFLAPIQIMVASFVVMPVRILSRKGDFGYNLMLWAIALAPMALFAFAFGTDELLRLFRAYHILG